MTDSPASSLPNPHIVFYCLLQICSSTSAFRSKILLEMFNACYPFQSKAIFKIFLFFLPLLDIIAKEPPSFFFLIPYTMIIRHNGRYGKVGTCFLKLFKIWLSCLSSFILSPSTAQDSLNQVCMLWVFSSFCH